jgi:fructokinase
MGEGEIRVSEQRRVLVCGEALVDLLPEGSDERQRFRPVLGGSPFNVAIGVARLEVETGYLGRLSSDRFGQQQRRRLAEAGVVPHWLQQGPEPTALAMVTLGGRDGREADYRFYLEGTAERSLDATVIPPHGADRVRLLHFGSFSLVLPPTAELFADMIRARDAEQLVSLDVNVRPAITPDLTDVRDRIDALRSGVDIIKASDEDLAHLFPDENPLEVCRHWAAEGTALIALTRGGDGATLLCGEEEISAPAPAVAVVDTVGAGDSFMAALIAAVMAQPPQGAGALSRQSPEALRGLLQRAMTAAAITCTRAGAQPPDRAELEAALTATPG